MSRQGRILAGQAVLSALILIVVYVTLLRPEGGGSLSGVETPNGGLPTPGQSSVERGADRGASDRSSRRSRRLPIAPGLLETAGVPGSVPTDGIRQPDDDQYTDSLQQLQARLAAG